LIPLRNTLVAAHLAAAAARGELEVLMILPLMLISPFVFMGLRYRVALLTGALSSTSFLVCALACVLDTGVLLRAGLLLVLAFVASAITAHKLEQLQRRAFLESHAMLELAHRDALTGAKNRRVFEEHLDAVWQLAGRDRESLAILLIDVDHFKAYNDRYGHLAGDEALRHVASRLQTLVHGSLDVLARYGGEEFAAVIYGADAFHAQQLAERMRRAVASLPIEHHGNRAAANVTVSIGVAAVHAVTHRDARGALQLADQALYHAKVRGRNRVELMDDAHYQSLVTGVFRTILAENA
ncbi:MAG TPA: GGDEF domain-containing protein, partial [Steroidobacteraceae bacterium]|nr:GGDEF domain-containing protein [Steroidobacteraceae bacterium]